MSTPSPPPSSSSLETKSWQPTYQPHTKDTLSHPNRSDTDPQIDEPTRLMKVAFARVNNMGLDHLEQQLTEAAELLKAGEVVAFPTETVYGLGGDATNTDAITKIYKAKGRPSDNPLIVHVATEQQLNSIVSHVPPIAKRLIHKFWPGPLTIILPHNNRVSHRVTAGLRSVAVRMPDHQVALALIKRSNVPVAAPSANTSGRPSPTSAKHVWDDLHGKVSGIVDGCFVKRGETETMYRATTLSSTSTSPSSSTLGNPSDQTDRGEEGNDEAVECIFGVESTVVDLSHLPADQDVPTSSSTNTSETDLSTTSSTPTTPLLYILRPGAVTKGMLEEVVSKGRVAFDPTLAIDVNSKDGQFMGKAKGGNEGEKRTEQEEKQRSAEEVATSWLSGNNKSHSPENNSVYCNGNSHGEKVGTGSNGVCSNGTECAREETELSAEDTKVATLLASSPNAMSHTSLDGYVPMAPGMKYTHYAPKAPLYLVVGDASAILQQATKHQIPRQKIGLLVTKETLAELKTKIHGDLTSTLIPHICGSQSNLLSVAANLYSSLRFFDDANVDVIYSETFPSDEMGAAVMNRLLKAAGGKVIHTNGNEAT